MGSKAFHPMLKHTVYSPYKASACHSAAGNEEAGICYVCVYEEAKERQAMECTPGADGADVAGTVEEVVSSVATATQAYIGLAALLGNPNVCVWPLIVAQLIN